MQFLSTEDLLGPAQDLQIGPLRHLGLLESAARRPATSLWAEDAYPTLDDKAATVLESLVRHHALVDANKRLDVASGSADVRHVAATLAGWH